ncbi:hypothetical protein BDZ89DRAFT_1108754 [Hymenopellis radicata]|nr:hypothetical protein BDZ89DRAFT_1108754 [Hymenopellis radicata]
MPSTSDITLRFEYSTSSNSDMRTFKVYQLPKQSDEPTIELYRFFHPITGLVTGSTSFHRQNLKTAIFESAGSIEWFSNHNATVTFGVNQYHIRELRKAKKSKSQSRRFKAGNAEYKWKIAENDNDIFCVDSKGKTVASWSQETLTLSVSSKVESILDRVVVTCFLNLWVRQLGDW